MLQTIMTVAMVWFVISFVAVIIIWPLLFMASRSDKAAEKYTEERDNDK